MSFDPGLAPTQPVLLSAGDGRIVHLFGDEMTLKASAEQTAGTLGVFECAIPLDAAGPPEHVHVTFDEAFYVLEGVLPLRVEGETMLLRSGAFAFVPRGTRHTFSNPSGAPIRFLTVCTPGGFENFFVDAAELPPSDAPDCEAINDRVPVRQHHRRAFGAAHMIGANRMNAQPALQAYGLRKRYGSTDVVRAIDLRVERREIFALVGPNGADKTTTVEILAGFIPRTSGEVTVWGADPQDAPREWREHLGIVLQESAADPGLTVAECIALYSGYYTRPMPADEILSIVGLREQTSARTTTLSGGQRRRLDLALALIGDSDLLFLDEPTTGFDPDARQHAWRD